MSCCGQKRAALTNVPNRRGNARPVSSAASASTEDTMALRYASDRRIALVGAVTGRSYRFDPGIATRVAMADAAALLAGGRFVRA